MKFFTGSQPNELPLVLSVFLVCLPTFARSEVITSIPHPTNGSTYHLITSDTWPASQAEAESLRGNLVTINNAAENDWVFQHFAFYGGVHRDLWLGLNDVSNEGSMVWVSGELVTFTNWQPGNPSNSGGVQDYVLLFAGPDGAHIEGWVPGKWDDFKSPENEGSSYPLDSGGTRDVYGVVEVLPDGKSDVLWRNDLTGDNYHYDMDGATIVSSGPVSTVSDLQWKIVGRGDYDGDGNADILWRHSVSGTNWLYRMNKADLIESLAVNTVSLDWDVVASGDYNGDGKSDILWRNNASGTNWLFLMDGATVVSSEWVSSVPDLNWKIINEN